MDVNEKKKGYRMNLVDFFFFVIEGQELCTQEMRALNAPFSLDRNNRRIAGDFS